MEDNPVNTLDVEEETKIALEQFKHTLNTYHR
jgi:hypothetical protein